MALGIEIVKALRVTNESELLRRHGIMALEVDIVGGVSGEILTADSLKHHEGLKSTTHFTELRAH